MENMIHLSVVTADGVALDTQVSYVNIPGGSGEIEVGDGVANAGGSEVTLLVSETKS